MRQTLNKRNKQNLCSKVVVKTQGIIEQERSSRARRRTEMVARKGLSEKMALKEDLKWWGKELYRNWGRTLQAAVPGGACGARKTRKTVWSFCKNPRERGARLDHLVAVKKWLCLEGRTNKIRRRRRKLRKEEEGKKREEEKKAPRPKAANWLSLNSWPRGLLNQPRRHV